MLRDNGARSRRGGGGVEGRQGEEQMVIMNNGRECLEKKERLGTG